MHFLEGMAVGYHGNNLESVPGIDQAILIYLSSFFEASSLCI
jgi:hypothetical protein